MSNAGHHRWLDQELPGLIQSGVLTADAAQRLRDHYGPPPAGAARRAAIIVCAVLGATLIGGGIILLFAHNWRGLSRPMRTVLALAPLLCAQAFAGWAFLQGRTATVWRETSGILVSLTLAAAIALVGQTYHIPGNLADFLLTWTLLTLPLVYLLGATLPALIYLIGITSWAGYAQNLNGHAAWFPLLLALILPWIIHTVRRDPYSSRATFQGWTLVLCLTIALGLSLEKILPGLWIMVYGCLFTAFTLAGRHWMRDAPSTWRNPFGSAGVLGTVALALLFTYEFGWDDVGWRYWRHGWPYESRTAWLDYTILTGLATGAATLIVHTISRRDLLGITFGALAPLTIIGYALAASDIEGVSLLLFNAYLLVLGIAITTHGVRTGRTGVVNGGLLTLSALIVARFFDEDFSFVVRGIAFIVIGIVFLTANIVLARRARGGAA
ncbi:MAG: DUF2157 domain-containing protein [Verrucomicrobia bacterium]|nr:DUF2157 domain-containing protein [Verrucomicrobiota bacterium]